MSWFRVAGVSNKDIVDLVSSMAVRGSGIPLAFIANLLVARLLGPTLYGSYMTLLSMALIASGISIWGMGTVMTREISSAPDYAWDGVLCNEGVWAVRRSIVLSVVSMGVLFVLMLLGFGVPESTGSERFWAILIVPISAMVILGSGILSGMHEVARGQSVQTLIRNGALLGCILIMFALNVAEVSHAMFAQVFSFMFALWIAQKWICQRSTQGCKSLFSLVNPNLGPERIRFLRHSSNHFFATTLAWLILGRIDVVIVNAISGTTEAGYFGAAARLGQFGGMAGLVWVAWLQPRVSTCLLENATYKLRKLLTYGLVGSLSMSALLVGGGWYFASEIMSLMGSGFQSSILPFRWLLLGYLPWAASVPFYAYLAMSGRERYLSRILWVQVIITVLASYPLVLYYGALGAAWAWAGGLAISSCIIIVSATLKEVKR